MNESIVKCPFCSGSKVDYVEGHTDEVLNQIYAIYACQKCSMHFAWPFQSGSEDWYRLVCTDAHLSLQDQKLYLRQTLFFGQRIPGKTVIDVGCANGRMVLELNKRGYLAEGIDFDQTLVEDGRRSGLKLKVMNLNSRTATVFQVTPGQTYDIAIATEVLEHLDQPHSFMESLRSALNPQGHLYLTLPNRNRPTKPFREWFDYPPHHISRWSPESLEAFMLQHGFEKVFLGTDELQLGYLFNTFLYPFNRDQMIKRLNRLFLGRGQYAIIPKNLGTFPATQAQTRKATLYQWLRKLNIGKCVARLLVCVERGMFYLSVPFLFVARAYFHNTRRYFGVSIIAVFKKIDRKD